MQFASLQFVYFFIIVMGLYWCLDTKWQNRLLLAASYFFYGYWDYRFLSLILISTLVDYVAAQRIYDARDRTGTKRWLWASIAANLGILFAFKYYGFFAESLQSLIRQFGFTADLPVLKIVLPIGISFYTFQTMSYTIDVYRKESEPSRNFINFAVFVAFFPQLLSGPIERAKNLLSQIDAPRQLTGAAVWTGLWWIMLGFYKKVVVAENLVPYTKPVFAEPRLFTSGETLEALYTGMFQVYCDFSGYSDIAVGLGALMGISLSWNFRQPLLSHNPSQLWRRWHVTLYYWLRDYLYFPVANLQVFGSRQLPNLIFAVLVTFFCAGLWHGASWNFMVWSMLLALLLIGHRLLLPVLNVVSKALGMPLLWRILGVLTFFHLWMLVSIFFAAENITVGMEFLRKLFSTWEAPAGHGMLTLLVFGLPLLIYEIAQEVRGEDLEFSRWSVGWQFLGISILFAAICLCSVASVREFEYFQF